MPKSLVSPDSFSDRGEIALGVLIFRLDQFLKQAAASTLKVIEEELPEKTDSEI